MGCSLPVAMSTSSVLAKASQARAEPVVAIRAQVIDLARKLDCCNTISSWLLCTRLSRAFWAARTIAPGLLAGDI